MVRKEEVMENQAKQTIGRAEKVSLPEFELTDVPAKIDTGAYSSSIDCSYVAERENDGQTVLEFTLFNPDSPLFTGRKLSSSDYTMTEVTSAHGVSQRYVVYTKITFRDISVRSRLTLTNRRGLRYPLLLGRQFLSGRFLVDVDVGAGLSGDEEERNL
jgi:hypothetical protein